MGGPNKSKGGGAGGGGNPQLPGSVNLDPVVLIGESNKWSKLGFQLIHVFDLLLTYLLVLRYFGYY